MTKQKPLRCDVCGKKGARLRRATRTYGRGKHLLVIENVPEISCPNCGESFITAQTLHELHRLRTHRKGLAKQRSVDVVSFG